jgi:uncharacterized protein involved in exopolysaccharide biosynthesis
MTRQKRTSSTLETAIFRASGMRSIDETLDYGHGLNIVEYETRIQTLRTKLTTYNDLLTSLDSTTQELDTLERALRSYSENMLLSTAARYGKTSNQYMQAGGTIRKTTKRTPPSATKTTPLPESIPTTPLTAAMN